MNGNKILMFLILVLSVCWTAVSCSTIPDGVTAVRPFDAEKYLGTWYEIARIDFKYERGLNNTTAEYSMNSDGSIRVVNRGYDYTNKKWKQAVGRAKFTKDRDAAMLEVSFFGPFYSGYNVIAIDAEYSYALVAGQSRDYLWILSRSKTIPDKIRREYLEKAERMGFDTSVLLWIEHD